MRRRTFCASTLGGFAAAALPFRLLANDTPGPTSSVEALSRIGKQLRLTPHMVTELRDALRGALLRASAAENPDLFWGVRGGGGNFGIVTAFQFRLPRVGPMITGGDIVYRIEDAREVLRFLADYTQRAADEVWIDSMIDRLEDGTARLVVAFSHCGNPPDAERELQRLRTLPRPLHDGVAAQTYAKVQASQDDLSPHGRGYYMTSGLVSRMEHDLIDASLEAARHPHARLGKISFAHHGGAIARLPLDHSAYPGRAGLHSVVVRASWDDPSHAQDRMRWGRETARTVAPFTHGYYANLSQETGPARVRNNYGANLERLVALKSKYDPLNLFRLNPNVEPRAATWSRDVARWL